MRIKPNILTFGATNMENEKYESEPIESDVFDHSLADEYAAEAFIEGKMREGKSGTFKELVADEIKERVELPPKGWASKWMKYIIYGK